MSHRRTFTVQEKAAIITRLKNGENNADLAKEFKISHSTISGIWKNRDKILECMDTKSLKMKRNRKSTHQDLEKALLSWIEEQGAEVVPLGGRVLIEQANHFARLLGKMNFQCTESWVHRFRKRHEYAIGRLCGDTSVMQNDSEDWVKTVLPKFTEGYTDDQIWNAGETELNYKFEKRLKFAGETVVGGKLSKDKFTVLVATSLAGEKRKLLVIGREKDPMCLKNVITMPVYYEANDRACITTEIFEFYLHEWDSELAKDGKKIILFMYTHLAHPKVDNLTNIKVAFLPSNITMIQPIDQGILKTFRTHYMDILIQKTIQNIENAISPFFINLLGAIEMLITAWARVTSRLIKKCFLHAGFGNPSLTESEEECDDELPQQASTSTSNVWESYGNNDNSNPADNETPDPVVSADVTIHEDKPAPEFSQTVKTEKEDSDDAEDDSMKMVEDIPTTEDALCAVTSLKRYCLFGEGKDLLNIDSVMRMEHVLYNVLALKAKLKKDCNVTQFLKITHE